MKQTTLTIRLDGDLERMLARASRRLRRTRSELAREALRRQLRLLQFESVRARVTASAEARGFLTDEDVFDLGR
jgi:predicted transcriptional regulator